MASGVTRGGKPAGRAGRSPHMGGKILQATDVAALKPFRDKTIHASIVACVVHSAEVGEYCHPEKNANCPTRRRMAIRRMHEKGEL